MRDEIYDAAMECARIRDKLDPIIKGQIERGHSPKGRVLDLGTRKTTLADARKIVEFAQARLNIAANALLDIEGPIKTQCPKCDKVLRHDDQYIKFSSGSSPLFTLTTKFRAEWCAIGCDYYRIYEIKEPSKIP